MKVLLLPDKLNWAYHSISKSLVKFNSDPDVHLSIEPIKKNIEHIRKSYKKYDLFLVMGWQTYELVDFLPKKNTLVGMHSHHSFDNRETTPDKDSDPSEDLVDHLLSFCRVNAVSHRLYSLFRNNGLENVHYTPNGVDDDIFKPDRFSCSNDFSVGYSGSKKHDWRKGVTEIILPSAERAGVKTKLAMLSTGDYLPLHKMPQFYNDIDVYICASLSEGFSLSVLEAASCGKPVISSRVGGCTDLIQDGVNGFLVDRDVSIVAEKIKLLKDDMEMYNKMSQAMRSIIVDKFSWKVQIDNWISFIKGQ